MKVRMTQLVIVLPLIAVALSKGETVRDAVNEGNAVRQEQSDFSSRIRQNRQASRQALKLSKVALDRIKGNCIRTIDAQTGKEGYFQPGAIVIDSALNRPVREGAMVCNSLGDTGVIDANGAIADIARVSLEDKAQYDLLFKKGD